LYTPSCCACAKYSTVVPHQVRVQAGNTIQMPGVEIDSLYRLSSELGDAVEAPTPEEGYKSRFRSRDSSRPLPELLEVFVYQVSVFGRVRSAVRFLRVAPVAIALAGIVGLTLSTTLFAAAPAADAASASWLHYQRGYYLDSGWLCYGWGDGAYHCTHHWHRAGGHLVSDHPSWVPNYGLASTVKPAAHSTVKHSAPRKSTSRVSSAPATSGGSVQSMIDSVFGPYAGQALSVARCESGYNSGAYNGISVGGSHAEGVFQILYPSTWYGTSYSGYSPYNAWANIHAAYQIFARDGFSWREWVCR
jgi:hypothetical protein